MFKDLENTIKSLNADVKNVANSEKAKKLRKKLLSIGLPLAIIGYLGVFICFVLCATAGFSSFSDNGFSARILVPFFLAIPCAVLGSIGSTLSALGFKIVITGYTTNLINETVGNNCPNCGDKITEGEDYCSKCGYALQKQCTKCGHLNSIKNQYCEKCGTQLPTQLR